MVIDDRIVVALRAVLMIGGGFLIGKGYVTAADFKSLADQITSEQTLGAIVSIGTAAWAMYVRWNTRSVPMTTAKRADVPTVSPLTGVTEPGPSHT